VYCAVQGLRSKFPVLLSFYLHLHIITGSGGGGGGGGGGGSGKVSTRRLIIESSSSSRRSSIADDDDKNSTNINGKLVEWKPLEGEDDEVMDNTKPGASPTNSVHSDSTLDGDEVIEVVSSPATPNTTAASIGQNDGSQESEQPLQPSPTMSVNASDYETEDAATPPVSPSHVTSHDDSGAQVTNDNKETEEKTTVSMDTSESLETAAVSQEQQTNKTKWEQYLNEMIKRIEENEADYSDEDPSPNKKVYLLSRTYHQIWNGSDYFNKRLLLEPAPGVEWSKSSKRPPLFDSDVQVQASYYRKWAAPTIIQCCEHCVLMSTSKKLVRSLNNVEKSGERRFLLTGPAQVSYHV